MNNRLTEIDEISVQGTDKDEDENIKYIWGIQGYR
jgi:hypothetical protein